MSEHIVKAYQEELRMLRDLIARMGGMVENQLSQATNAMVRRDVGLASRVVEADPQVDALDRDIAHHVVKLLALRQPVASDLRLIVAAMRIASDLERVGDYAANVAKRSIVLAQMPPQVSMGPLERMSRMVQEMLKDTLDAFATDDAAKAMEVWRRDEPVDEMYSALFRTLLTYMMEDPRNITPCTHLLFIAKNLERIGDHATNIAEIIHFAVVGEEPSGMRPKGDTSALASADMGETGRAP
ncbi:phosphate signaling complex protein PhoU [Elioraea sp.]|uniref:phosphate signaling complex protein PhoU n=1 Tax=Elioraea sp. TaxID=2185103 RepID=UPI0025BCBF05|nr:phosphate signaling complex protein PhoU [Elioraea sp.]